MRSLCGICVTLWSVLLLLSVSRFPIIRNHSAQHYSHVAKILQTLVASAIVTVDEVLIQLLSTYHLFSDKSRVLHTVQGCSTIWWNSIHSGTLANLRLCVDSCSGPQ